METLTSMKDNSSKIKIDLCSMSIKRNNSTGITLKIKSQKFEDFFKNNEANRTGNTVKVNGVKITESLRTVSNIPTAQISHFRTDTAYLKDSHGIVNLNFLTEERIGQGVEFDIQGRYSVEAMNEFKRQFKEAVTTFFIDNMQNVVMNLDISVLANAPNEVSP
jgi:hypothetical protein